MTRSTYSSSTYATLMRHVRDEEWPRLERAAGMVLVHPLDVMFFGSDRAILAGYAAAVQAAGVAVERLPVGEARRGTRCREWNRIATLRRACLTRLAPST